MRSSSRDCLRQNKTFKILSIVKNILEKLQLISMLCSHISPCRAKTTAKRLKIIKAHYKARKGRS